jgi:hypothetical protein
MIKNRRKKLDEFHWHEALDRSLLAFEFFQEHVEEHDAVRKSPALRHLAKDISERMFRLYQTIGASTLKQK